MRQVLLDALRRFTSTKFLTAVGAYILVLLDGLGEAQFSAEVMVIASSALVAYIGANVVEKAVTNNSTAPPAA